MLASFDTGISFNIFSNSWGLNLHAHPKPWVKLVSFMFAIDEISGLLSLLPDDCNFFTVSIIILEALLVSSSVVFLPTEKRMVPMANSVFSLMAVKTGETSILSVWQAAP